jgi:Tol biopolymer transport system component
VDFDRGLNAAVARLRQVLQDSAETPRYIETIARRGYRFIAPVEIGSVSPAPGASEPVTVSGRRRHPARAPTAAVSMLMVAAVVGFTSWKANAPLGDREAPTSAVPLTGNPGYEAFPSFSPEGARVAFSWQKPGQEGASIFVKLIGPGDPVALTGNAQDFGPAWSPDGRQIAFLRARGGARATIMIVPAVGGHARELSEIGLNLDQISSHSRSIQQPPPFLAWSADSRWLASTDQNTAMEASSIVRISLETGEKRQITSPPAGGQGDGSLAVSPSGKMLAFARSVGLFERNVYLLSVSSELLPLAAPVRLTFDAREIESLTWTADGQRLVFSCSGRGGRELWETSTRPPGKTTRLAAAADDPRQIAMSPQGRYLVYSHYFHEAHIWRISHNRKPEEPELLITSSRRESHPQYSPDGRRIAFQSNRTGNDQIWTSDADGGNQVQLTSLGPARAGSPRWSPDGRMIAFDANVAGNWDIYVVASSGGKPIRVTTGGASKYRPSWSRDGQWIYYCSTQTGPPQVWKIRPAGGGEIEMTRNGGCVPFESDDGREVYYAKETGLWKMPAQGGPEVKVLGPILQNCFALANRGLYFIDPSSPGHLKPRLNVMDFATRAVRTIAAINSDIGDELSVSPDGRSILFQKTARTSSELMLIENFH